MRRYTTMVLATVFASAMVVSSCSGTESSTAATASDGSFPRTVDHVRGTTEVPTEPVRIVSLDNSYSDAVLLLEGSLVGYVDYRDPGLPDYLGSARETYAGEAESVGTTGEPNLERIAALEPDLILSAEVRDGPRYDSLSALAPTVFSETTGPTWKDNIRLAARAMGKEDRAEAEIGAYEARARAIGDDIRATGGDPTVSVVRFAGEPTARLYRTTSFSGIVLSDVGLTRPASQQADPSDPYNIITEISPELISEADGDVIFVATTADGSDAAQPFLTNPLWNTLRGHKIEVDDSLWMLPVSVQGAHRILDDMAESFGVDPHEIR